MIQYGCLRKGLREDMGGECARFSNHKVLKGKEMKVC